MEEEKTRLQNMVDDERRTALELREQLEMAERNCQDMKAALHREEVGIRVKEKMRKNTDQSKVIFSSVKGFQKMS